MSGKIIEAVSPLQPGSKQPRRRWLTTCLDSISMQSFYIDGAGLAIDAGASLTARL